VGSDIVQSTRSLPTFRYSKCTDILWKIILNVLVKWVVLIFFVFDGPRIQISVRMSFLIFSQSLQTIAWIISQIIPPPSPFQFIMHCLSSHLSRIVWAGDKVLVGSIGTLHSVDTMVRWIRNDLKGRGRVSQLMFRHLFGGNDGSHKKSRPEQVAPLPRF
jgi:hypothetical protein